MMRHRGALTRAKTVLEGEICKIKYDVEQFEENELVIDETAENIEENARTLLRENFKFRQLQKLLFKEQKSFDKTIDIMSSNHDNLEAFNDESKESVSHFTTIVESLKETAPKLDKQLDAFHNLRTNVQNCSDEMSGEVDCTTATVKTIFNELQDLTIR